MPAPDPPVTWVATCPEHGVLTGRGDRGETLCKHGHEVARPKWEPFVALDTVALMLLSDGKWDLERAFGTVFGDDVWDRLAAEGWSETRRDITGEGATVLSTAGRVELLARLARARGRA